MSLIMGHGGKDDNQFLKGGLDEVTHMFSKLFLFGIDLYNTEILLYKPWSHGFSQF